MHNCHNVESNIVYNIEIIVTQVMGSSSWTSLYVNKHTDQNISITPARYLYSYSSTTNINNSCSHALIEIIDSVIT